MRSEVYFVTLTRWAVDSGYRTRAPRDPESESAHLGPLLSLTAYEMKQRLHGPLPRIVAVTVDQAEARRWARALIDRGHGSSTLCSSEIRVRFPARFRFLEGAIECGARTIPFAEIELFVSDGWSANAPSAPPEGALDSLLNRTGSSPRREPRLTPGARVRVVYVFGRNDVVALAESRLAYDGLPTALAATSLLNFNALCNGLYRAAPHAAQLDASAIHVAENIADRARVAVAIPDELRETHAAARSVVAYAVADAHRAGDL